MINVSDDFKERMKESRDFKSYAEITFPKGDTLNLDSSQFVVNNNRIYDGSDISNFPIGVAVKKDIQIEILNDAEQYKDYNFVGAKIRNYLDFQLDEINPFEGRNLVANSAPLTLDGWRHSAGWELSLVECEMAPYEKAIHAVNNGGSNGFYKRLINAGDVIIGEKYTISAWVRASKNCKVKFYNERMSTNVIDVTTEWKYFSYTDILRSDAIYSSNVFYPLSSDVEDGMWIEAHSLKFERGDTATGYTIAPEDIRVERIEKGTYTVVTPETYGETVIITAYDDMYKADKDYTTKLTFPQTAAAVLRDICSTCDITLGSTTFLHDDFIIQDKPTGKFREIIGYIAMIACGNARIDNRNRLQIISYDLDWGYDVNVGMNLLLNSDFSIGNDFWKGSNGTSHNVSIIDGKTAMRIDASTSTQSNGFVVQETGVELNTKYTFSVKVYTDKEVIAVLSVWYNDSGWKEISSKYLVLNPGWNDSSITFTSDSVKDNLIVGIGTDKANEIYFYHPKLEKGSIVTDWTTSPEDGGNPYYLLSEWQAPKIEYNDSMITGFKTIVKGDTSDDDVEVIAGTDAYMVTIDNPLISGHEETVVSWLLETIGNVPFRPFSGDLVSNPLIEFMDLVQVQDRRGNLYDSFLTDVNFLLPGYTTVKNSSPSMERAAISYASDSSKTEITARKLIEKEKTDRELAIERLAQSLGEGSGMFSTEEKQLDGSVIYYLHDKPTIAESKNVMKLTSEAIGLSVDGGKTYPFGFQLDGEMVMRIIQTEGLNADWLNTGAITVSDSSGNIIFSVDMDTKQVIISGDSVRIGGKTATAAINDVLAESKDYSDGKLADYANTVTANITNLQSQIDGQIETFYYDYEPTLQNIPASQWTTTEERRKHEGDLFYWKSKGYAYRFFQDGATWKWQLVQDTDITQAMAAAEKAQDTADGKRRVFVVTPQPPYDIGDLWTNGTDILTCAVSRAAGSVYVSSDWKKLNKYTDDTFAQKVQQNLDNLQIGGRNLTANTAPTSLSGWTANLDWTLSLVDCATAPSGKAIRATNGTATSGGVHKQPIAYTKMVNGEKYTISAWIRASKACNINFQNEMMGTNTVSVTTSWKKYTFTSTINTGLQYHSNIFYVSSGIENGMWLEIHSLKLEKGTKATDWSPAPEDTETYADNLAADLQTQIDGKIQTYNQTSDPSTAWTTTELKTQHTGDLWYDPTTKETKRWNGTAWVKLENKEAEEAGALAQKKAQVFTGTPTVPYHVGDLWFNSATSDIMTCIKERTTGSYTASDWEKRNKYTDDTKANEALEEAKKSRNLNIILDNEYQGISTDYQGNTSVFPEVKVSVQTLYGQTDVSTDCSYSIQKSSGVTGTWNNASRTYTITALTEDTGWVDITASYLNLFTATKRFNVSKIRSGIPGTNGAAGRTYFMEPSTLVVKRRQDNAIFPNYITFSAYYRDGSSTARTAYPGRFKIEESTDGDTWETVYVSDEDEESITHSLYSALATTAGGAISTASDKTIGIPRNVVAIRCTLYAAGGASQMLDIQGIAVLTDVEALTHDEIFNLLTNNGEVKGIYQEGNQLYISFTYAKGGNLDLGGPNNGKGMLRIFDSGGELAGSISNDFIRLFDSNDDGSEKNSLFASTFGISIYNKLLKYEIGLRNNELTLKNNNLLQTTTLNTYGLFVYKNSTKLVDISTVLCTLPSCNFTGSISSTNNITADGDLLVKGRMAVVGTKTRLVETQDYQNRLQYCYEMSSPMFGDIGEAETDENGECYIYLDDIFSETVNSGVEYQVFIQKEGPGDIWVSEKNACFFVVKGTKNLKFAWEIKVKQLGYEFERLEEYGRDDINIEKIDYESDYMDELIDLMKKQEEIYETA